MGILRISSYPIFIHTFLKIPIIAIFIDIVFLLMKQTGRRITLSSTMKSYISHTVTDRVLGQNYYNYEQYKQSQWIEAFCSLVSLRLKYWLQLKIYSLNVKKNNDIHEVTKYNIITFSLNFFSRFVFVCINIYRRYSHH